MAPAAGIPNASGTLYVVGTPIGNLGDLSPRAAELLKSADLIAAEDTRRTRALLTHLGARGVAVERLDANARASDVERFVERLLGGARVALVTDAGMPSTSDPGAVLVRAAAERGIEIVTVPGPSAVSAAASVSGLVDGPFLFLGFLPRDGKKRERAIARIAASPEPVVLFEAPSRTAATLRELATAMPERRASVSRELTKLHEETVRSTLSELAERDDWRGEVTIVIAAADASQPAATTVDEAELEARIAERLRAGASVRSVVDELVVWSGRPRRELYARVQAARDRPRTR